MTKRKRRSARRRPRRDAVRLSAPDLRALRALARVSHPGWFVSTDPSWKVIMLRLVDRRLAEKGFDQKSGRPAWRITAPGRLVLAASPALAHEKPRATPPEALKKPRRPDTRKNRKRSRKAYFAGYREKNREALIATRKAYLSNPEKKAAYLASKRRYAERKRRERADSPDSPEAITFREAERERHRRRARERSR